MTCARAAGWMQLYVDGRLEMRRIVVLERHLADCAACRSDWRLLEVVCEAAAGHVLVAEPADLTQTIMRRVADLEVRRAAARSGFAPGWGDGALAVVLATLATAIFLIFQPALRQTVTAAVESTVRLAVVGSSSWLAWLVWVVAGLCLAIWFAGSEVRAGWRRALMDRLPH